MALPNIQSFKNRVGNARAWSTGAMAAAAITLAAPATAQSVTQGDAPPPPAATAMEEQASFYQDLGGFAPQAPTAERPYYLMELNADTKQAYTGFGPNDIILAESASKDKIVVFNFVREGDRFSEMQTDVISDAMGQLGPQSWHQNMMLVNVSIADQSDTPLYAADFATLYEDNQLIDYDGSSNTLQVPYMSIYGIHPVEGRDPNFQQVGTFALMNGVKTDVDLQANADAILYGLGDIVDYYNKNSPHQAPEP